MSLSSEVTQRESGVRQVRVHEMHGSVEGTACVCVGWCVWGCVCVCSVGWGGSGWCAV